MYRTSPTAWWTRYHTLGRKIKRQGGHPTANDVRLAAVLTQLAIRADRSGAPLGGGTPHTAGGGTALAEAVRSMEWVLDYGYQSFEKELARRKAEARMGEER